MAQTVNDAIQEYRAELEQQYVVNGSIKKTYLWKYVNLTQAIDIVEDVNDDIDENDDINVLQDVVNKYGNLSKLIDEIEDDDYIIPDWNSNTDYHDYAIDVISTAKELLK